MTPKKLLFLAASALSVLALAPALAFAVGAGRTAGRTASTHTVVLEDIRFHPPKLEIRHGESVRWLWEDDTDHNVTFHSFHSRTQEHGSYTVTFPHSGTFNYRCTIHASEGMRGEVIVR
jgi:plastocyanin